MCDRRKGPRRFAALFASDNLLVLANEDIGQGVGFGIASGERLYFEAMLDEAEDRGSFVLGVIHKALPDHRSDEDGGNASSGTPLVDDGRSDMIPAAAELIVRDDDQRILGVLALLDGRDEIRDMLLPREQVGVARVLVVRTERLYEADCGKPLAREVGEEIGFILQVPCRPRVAVAVGEKWRVVVVVREGLMVPLEKTIDRGRVRRGWVG